MHGKVTYTGEVRNAEQKDKLTPAEKRLMVFELLAVSFGIMLAVTVGIDILFSHGIFWSRYTSLILVLVWLFSAIPLILWGHPWLVFSVLGPALIAGVFLWALFTGDLYWFLMPGLPMAALVEVTILVSFVLVAIQKHKGMNAVGVVLAAGVFLCSGIDLIVGYTVARKAGLTWSVIVLVAVLPVAGFFFYLHYRVMNRATLRKLFRL
jgi:hypothetical protein